MRTATRIALVTAGVCAMLFAASAPALVRPIVPGSGARAYYFGDSFTMGYGASDEIRHGYPMQVDAAMGWTGTIDGLGGSGFVEPGPSGRTYSQRLAQRKSIAADVIVIEGGLNDEKRPAAEVGAAARRVIARFREMSTARVVLIGPFNPYPKTPPNLSAIDRTLRVVAHDTGVPYISPISEAWEVAPYTYNDKRHPDDAGYAYISTKISADLKALSR